MRESCICRQPELVLVKCASRENLKTSENERNKIRSEMEAHSDKFRGLNLNPLAPAKAKRPVPFSEET